MILVRITMNVIPEKQKEMLQTLVSMLESPVKDLGRLSFGVYCDIEDRNVFSLISEWDTRTALNHFLRSDRFSVLLGTKSLLNEPLGIRIHTVLDSEGMDAVAQVRIKTMP